MFIHSDYKVADERLSPGLDPLLLLAPQCPIWR
jgi:hypothetical protein